MTTTLTARLRRHLRVKRYAMGADPKTQTLRQLEQRVSRRKFMGWMSDLYNGGPEDQKMMRDNLADESSRLDHLDDYLNEEHQIRVRPDGLIEFSTADPATRRIIGDLPVAVFHHTTDAIDKKVMKEGLKVRTGKRANPHQNSEAGVYVTTERSGPAVSGYHGNATGYAGGSPRTWTVRTTLDDLSPDPDDQDISSGRHQFVLPYVHPDNLIDDDRPRQMSRRRYASYDVSTPSVSISIPVPGPAAPAPKPKPAPQPAPAPAPAPPAAPVPAPEPTPRAFIFPFAPAPRRRMARGRPRRYAHADEPAMHAAIAADPAENTTGLVYADMLEENDKPAHAEVVRNYIKRTGQPAMVRRRGMLDWTADPDIPWETGVMAGPVGHLEPADRDLGTDPITENEPGWWRVHLFRRTPDRRILHWTANVNGREHAAALVRRLHAEAQQSVPPGGEVLLDHHAGNFVNLPARYQRLARRTLTVRPHAEPASVARPTRRQILLSLKRAGRNGATTPNRP